MEEKTKKPKCPLCTLKVTHRTQELKDRAIKHSPSLNDMEPGGAIPQSYYMTDKAGHLCRFTKINKCNTLQATDYKDPPVIVTTSS